MSLEGQVDLAPLVRISSDLFSLSHFSRSTGLSQCLVRTVQSQVFQVCERVPLEVSAHGPPEVMLDFQVF